MEKMSATTMPKMISAQNSLRKLYSFYFVCLFVCQHVTFFPPWLFLPIRNFKGKAPSGESENSLDIKGLLTFEYIYIRDKRLIRETTLCLIINRQQMQDKLAILHFGLFDTFFRFNYRRFIAKQIYYLIQPNHSL